MDSFLISQESGHPIEKDFAFNNNVANAHVTVRLSKFATLSIHKGYDGISTVL